MYRCLNIRIGKILSHLANPDLAKEPVTANNLILILIIPQISLQNYLLMLTIIIVSAALAATQRHPLTDIPPSAPGIEFKEWFPDFFSLQFPAGKQVNPTTWAKTLAWHSRISLTPTVECFHQELQSLSVENFAGLAIPMFRMREDLTKIVAK